MALGKSHALALLLLALSPRPLWSAAYLLPQALRARMLPNTFISL